MELDENKIRARIKELEIILYVPPGGRVGGSWENKDREELERLYQLLALKK